MIAWLATAWAGSVVLDVPFPTARLFDKPDRVCLTMPSRAPDSDSRGEFADFAVTCRVERGRLSACVELLADTWPESVPALRCGPPGHEVEVRPVPAFDPTEDVWDGVSIVRGVAVLQAAYRVEHPNAPGLLDGGGCGITDGRFWFKTRSRARRQRCILVIGETEREVPIRVVRSLPRP